MQETRRNFLKTGCALLTGATVASGINLLNVKDAKATSAEHPYGWSVTGLNVADTADLGYEGYYGTTRFSPLAGKDCASSVFAAIIGQLQEEFAADPTHPYHGIPLAMMQWGGGGVVDFSSLCGALNGACAAIGLVCNKDDAEYYISDLLTWYSESSLPVHPSPVYGPHPQSVANSNLCHVSVTNWCLASGLPSGSPERSNRCACLSADVASKVVEMLNSGVPLGLGNPRDNNTTCGVCHYKGPSFEFGQFTRGKMNCLPCHTDIRTVKPDDNHHIPPVTAPIWLLLNKGS